MVSLSEITLEADRCAAELAAQLAGEPENRFQGMPSDGDSRAGYEAMGAAGWIGLHWPEELGGFEKCERVRLREWSLETPRDLG